MTSYFTLWMERQFSGTEIANRMISAARLANIDLRVLSSRKQEMPDTQVLNYPDFDKGAPAIAEANANIAQYGINALWVRRSLRFTDALAKLQAPAHAACSPEAFTLVDDKNHFNEWLGNDPVRPNAIQVIGLQQLTKAYGECIASWGEVCIKPVKGVNGSGYWHLTHEDSLIFSDPDRRRMPPEAYFIGLGIEDNPTRPTPLLLMEWLPGPEVSIDILCWEGEPLIHAARTKKINRDAQEISSDHPMIEHARMLAKSLRFHGIISVQYRLDKKRNWKILEINPRPAGGCINSEDAGFGIVTAWTKLVLGIAGPEDIAQVHDTLTLEFDRVPRIVR